MSDTKIFWIIYALGSVVLFAILTLTRIVTPLAGFSAGPNYLEQALYALMLSPYPAFLVFFGLKRCKNSLAFRRLLLCGGSKAMIVFLLQVTAFVLFEIFDNLPLPAASNLLDAGLANQIATYSRVPLLSQFVGGFLFLSAAASRSIPLGARLIDRLIPGFIIYVIYLIGFVICHQLWGYYLGQIFFPPNRINLFLLFVHWLPTVYFLLLAYLYSLAPKK